MHIDILGTPYNIKFQTDEENNKLKAANADGYAELYSKELIIRTGYEDSPTAYKDIVKYREKVLRHEVIHAFFHECGLSDYTDDEKLVDFLALQFPKLVEIIKQAQDIHEEIMEYDEDDFDMPDILGNRIGD